MKNKPVVSQKKNILVYIQSSEGELEWISPWIVSARLKFNFFLFIDEIDGGATAQSILLQKYGIADHVSLRRDCKGPMWSFTKGLVGRCSSLVARVYGQSAGNRFSQAMCRLVGIFVRHKSPGYDVIMRDSNMKPALSYTFFRVNNKSAKKVLFPHSYCNVSRKPAAVCEPDYDLFLKTSHLCGEYIARQRAKKVVVVGAPVFSALEKRFRFDSKAFVLVTRPPQDAYALDADTCIDLFQKTLESAAKNRWIVLVKHHPRDRCKERWRKVQAEYDNVVEIDSPLTGLPCEVAFALAFFSSAPIVLVASSIPVFDISPYSSIDGHGTAYGCHYVSQKTGRLTHDLLEYGVFDELSDSKGINALLTDSVDLAAVSSRQFRAFEKYFPRNAVEDITQHLLTL